MTDRDHAPDGSSEGFLGRWSRKKAEAERAAPASPAEARATDVSLPGEPGLPARDPNKDPKAQGSPAPKPEFDLASLPSLDSITAATDIRSFLAPGVPKELARAALRRAWSADPAIRDFVGLAENAWDFTDPEAMAGFGALPPGYDVKQLLAQIFGDGEQATDPGIAPSQRAATENPRIAEDIAPPAPPVEAASSPASDEDFPRPDIPAGAPQVAQGDFVHRNNNIAMQNSIPDNNSDGLKNRRQHGGALPQ